MTGDCAFRIIPDNSAENVPMHPEDYAALLAWVRAKEGEMKQSGLAADEQ